VIRSGLQTGDKNTMKVGIFGGTFDPIHFGHLNLAIRVLEKLDLNEIWFIPTSYSPFKTEEQSSPIEIRMEMVYLAIDNIPHFRLIDIETERPGPSYTIDTLKELQRDYPDHDFRLLMGYDAMRSFHEWKDPEEIVKIAPPVIACRNGKDFNMEVAEKDFVHQKLKQGICPIPIMEISSTDVRDRIQKGLYCGHLLPPKVLDFILDNHLYS